MATTQTHLNAHEQLERRESRALFFIVFGTVILAALAYIAVALTTRSDPYGASMTSASSTPPARHATMP